MRGDTDGDQILTRQELEVLHPRRKPWRQPR
jgi:hypothetical protein